MAKFILMHFISNKSEASLKQNKHIKEDIVEIYLFLNSVKLNYKLLNLTM